METSVPRKVADLELLFSHKPGQVTLDQDILHVEISLRTTKKSLTRAIFRLIMPSRMTKNAVRDFLNPGLSTIARREK